jgi:hypothetical protein
MRRAAFVALGALLLATPAIGQPPAGTAAPPAPARRPTVIPQTFTNLQVLPKDISRADLMNVMRSMSMPTSLKIRCAGCHAVSDDLTEGDFASDEKPAKVEARKMLQAIMALRAAPAAAAK